MLPAKENPSLGRLELRLLFFASLISPPFLRIPFLREPRKSVKGLFRALPGARGLFQRVVGVASYRKTQFPIHVWYFSLQPIMTRDATRPKPVLTGAIQS